MKTVIKKHLNVEKIERIARENKYDEQAYNLFLTEIEKLLIKELYTGFTDKSEDCIISKVVEYISEVQALRKKGYGIEWATEYVYRSHRPEKVHAVAFACVAINDGSNLERLKNLKLYAQLTGRDENFVEYFNFLLDEPESNVIFDVPVEESAENYSNTIKKLLAEGKSKIYAKNYAHNSAIYVLPPYQCHIYAMEAESADKDVIDEDELFDYADCISRYIYDNFDVYEDSLTDDKVNRMRKEYTELPIDFFR